MSEASLSQYFSSNVHLVLWQYIDRVNFKHDCPQFLRKLQASKLQTYSAFPNLSSSSS